MNSVTLKGKTEDRKRLIRSLLSETWLTSWELIRITVPVAVLTKVLEEFGVVSVLSAYMEPVMELLGLPGSLGLVWATAMLTNIYAGIAVFATLFPTLTLTSGQITVLCSIILIAHSLPMELSISKRAGAPLLPIAGVRVLGAIIYGCLLYHLSRFLGVWQEPVTVLLLKTAPGSGNFLQWIADLIVNLAGIVLIILLIILAMRALKGIGVLRFLERILAPVLPFFGMSEKAAPITVIGMLMGIGYGGALIIREIGAGHLTKEEVFHSMVLMGLCHALVEDTLLMAAIGGKFIGILIGRILFSLGITYLIVCLSRFRHWRRAEQQA